MGLQALWSHFLAHHPVVRPIVTPTDGRCRANCVSIAKTASCIPLNSCLAYPYVYVGPKFPQHDTTFWVLETPPVVFKTADLGHGLQLVCRWVWNAILIKNNCMWSVCEPAAMGPTRVRFNTSFLDSSAVFLPRSNYSDVEPSEVKWQTGSYRSHVVALSRSQQRPSEQWWNHNGKSIVGNRSHRRRAQ